MADSSVSSHQIKNHSDMFLSVLLNRKSEIAYIPNKYLKRHVLFFCAHVSLQKKHLLWTICKMTLFSREFITLHLSLPCDIYKLHIHYCA